MNDDGIKPSDFFAKQVAKRKARDYDKKERRELYMRGRKKK